MLKWDSDFFGITVAQITSKYLATQELVEIVQELKKQKVKIVYWSSESRYDDNTIKKLHGRLVDLKTSFFIDLKTLDNSSFVSGNIVEKFRNSWSIKNLYELAIQSGEHSRFAVDPKIPRKKFLDLYITWMKKSISREMADEVLVIHNDDSFAGMVTVRGYESYGKIGLLAVDSHYRGRKYGEELVRSALKWFISHGFKYGRVITQGSNGPSCGLYKKCGYSIEKVEYFYHFWL